MQLQESNAIHNITIKLKAPNSESKTNLLLYTGDFDHALYGKFKITNKELDQAVANFNNGIAARFDENDNAMLPGNYQHASNHPSAEISKACGWAYNLRCEGKGKEKKLVADIDWTKAAKEFIEQKEFLFISPEFTSDYKDENGKTHGFTIVGFALTNINFLKKNQLPVKFNEIEDFKANRETRWQLEEAFWQAFEAMRELIVAKMKAENITDINELTKLIKKFGNMLPEAINNFYKKNKGEITMNEELKKLLNLTDDSTGVKEVQGLIDKIAELDSKKKELSDELNRLQTDATNANEHAQKLSERVLTLENAIRASEADRFISGQIYNPKTGQGKLTEAQREKWTSAYLSDPILTKELLESMPVVVDSNEVGSAGGAKKPKKFDDPTVEVADRVKELQTENPKIRYMDAVKQVLEEDKDLAVKYAKYRKG